MEVRQQIKWSIVAWVRSVRSSGQFFPLSSSNVSSFALQSCQSFLDSMNVHSLGKLSSHSIEGTPSTLRAKSGTLEKYRKHPSNPDPSSQRVIIAMHCTPACDTSTKKRVQQQKLAPAHNHYSVWAARSQRHIFRPFYSNAFIGPLSRIKSPMHCINTCFPCRKAIVYGKSKSPPNKEKILPSTYIGSTLSES